MTQVPHSGGTVSLMTPSPWHHPIADYLDYLRAGGAPRTTIDLRRQHLQFLARHFGGSPWTIPATRMVQVFGALECAQETRRSRRTTLRAFYLWAVESGHTATNTAASLPKVRATKPNPRPVPDVVYAVALDAAKPRERLMLRLAAECGLRRTEVATAHCDHLIQDLDGWTIHVIGKGRRERDVPLPPDLARDLRALPYGYLFPGSDDGHLSPRWVGTLLSRLLPGIWTMHKLRHRALTRWYAVEKDIYTVRDLAGHGSIAATEPYVQTPHEARRRTVEAAA